MSTNYYMSLLNVYKKAFSIHNGKMTVFRADYIIEHGLDRRMERELREGGIIIAIPGEFTGQQVRHIVDTVEKIPSRSKNIFTSLTSELIQDAQWIDI